MAVHPIDLERYLSGIMFPASKNDLRQKALDNHAPDFVIDIINNLPERYFSSSGDLSKAVDEIE
jgi:hypothetical protein